MTDSDGPISTDAMAIAASNLVLAWATIGRLGAGKKSETLADVLSGPFAEACRMVEEEISHLDVSP